ncbi:hypothetical protein ANANG_G00073350 [Anguilla anguilla]|uniref:Uncharacterized protein n=1 Tax=Anguilla anguilla TaxID=7936 RepID=A0A9D3MT96_ANGAN|nr:hypothetical protein ANANG_G00073350 [Anguilla anguilla]
MSEPITARRLSKELTQIKPLESGERRQAARRGRRGSGGVNSQLAGREPSARRSARDPHCGHQGGDGEGRTAALTAERGALRSHAS